MNGRKALSVFGLCVASLAVLGGLLTAILSYKMTHWIKQTQVTLGPDSQSEVRRERSIYILTIFSITHFFSSEILGRHSRTSAYQSVFVQRVEPQRSELDRS